MSFKLKFWGVRGSIACPGQRHMVYGGNTACLEVSAGGERFIFDGGTGIRNLGQWLPKKGVREATVLFSHTHWDHINGLPFFAPAYQPGNHFRLLAGHLGQTGGIASIFARQMSDPYFPVPTSAMRANLRFEDFTAGDRFGLGVADRVGVRTAPLNHPNGATGYRLDYQGRSLCYVTDTEHRPGTLDANILGLIEGADLLIYDCTYTDQEFAGKIGWGHSTWQEGIRLAQTANVRRLAIFHHDPDHDDSFMDRLALAARREWAGAFVARESMRLDLHRLVEEELPRPVNLRPRLITVGGRRA